MEVRLVWMVNMEGRKEGGGALCFKGPSAMTSHVRLSRFPAKISFGGAGSWRTGQPPRQAPYLYSTWIHRPATSATGTHLLSFAARGDDCLPHWSDASGRLSRGAKRT